MKNMKAVDRKTRKQRFRARAEPGNHHEDHEGHEGGSRRGTTSLDSARRCLHQALREIFVAFVVALFCPYRADRRRCESRSDPRKMEPAPKTDRACRKASAGDSEEMPPHRDLGTTSNVNACSSGSLASTSMSSDGCTRNVTTLLPGAHGGRKELKWATQPTMVPSTTFCASPALATRTFRPRTPPRSTISTRGKWTKTTQVKRFKSRGRSPQGVGV